MKHPKSKLVFIKQPLSNFGLTSKELRPEIVSSCGMSVVNAVSTNEDDFQTLIW